MEATQKLTRRRPFSLELRPPTEDEAEVGLDILPRYQGGFGNNDVLGMRAALANTILIYCKLLPHLRAVKHQAFYVLLDVYIWGGINPLAAVLFLAFPLHLMGFVVISKNIIPRGEPRRGECRKISPFFSSYIGSLNITDMRFRVVPTINRVHAETRVEYQSLHKVYSVEKLNSRPSKDLIANNIS